MKRNPARETGITVITESDARTLRHLVDHERLRTLFNTYVTGLDDIDEEERGDDWYATIFTPDVDLSFPIGSRSGLEGLAEFHRAAKNRWADTFHIAGDVRLTIHGVTAEARVSVLSVHVHLTDDQMLSPPPPARFFSTGGVYRARALLTEDGWRITWMSFEVVWSQGEKLRDVSVDPR